MRAGRTRATHSWGHRVLVAVWVARYALFAAVTAHAQAPMPTSEPPRYLATLSVGAPLRLSRNVKFDQSVLAPIYADALGAYVLSSASRLRQAVGVGLSINLSEDGGFTEPVGIADQFVVMPSYLLYWDVDPNWLALAHLGIPVLASGGRSAGLEAGAGMGYRCLAGFGLYAEAAFAAFVGAASALHPTFSLELGVFLDYEVLP